MIRSGMSRMVKSGSLSMPGLAMEMCALLARGTKRNGGGDHKVAVKIRGGEPNKPVAVEATEAGVPTAVQLRRCMRPAVVPVSDREGAPAGDARGCVSQAHACDRHHRSRSIVKDDGQERQARAQTASPYHRPIMFETDTSLHDLQDQLREDIKRERRRMFVYNMMAIAVGVTAVVLYWYLF